MCILRFQDRMCSGHVKKPNSLSLTIRSKECLIKPKWVYPLKTRLERQMKNIY